MDFVVGLLKSKSFDAIWVVVDRLSKQRHFVPYMTTIDSQGLATLFIDNIFRLHGLPDSIVSDPGPRFAADFWHFLCGSLCHGVTPREVILESGVDQTPYLTMAVTPEE